MSVDAKWLRYEQWTLLEAAQIVAEVEPLNHAIVGDDPHMILARIVDESARTTFDELYRQSKDAVNRQSLSVSEAPRTRKVGNTRILPTNYLAWAKSKGFHLRPELAEMVVETSEEEPASPESENWKMRIQAEAKKRWIIERNKGCNPTKLALLDGLAAWCEKNEVRTDTTGVCPKASYIYRHVLRQWTPPSRH